MLALIFVFWVVVIGVPVGRIIYRVESNRNRRRREIAQAYQEVAEAVKNHPNKLVKEHWQRSAEYWKKEVK